MELSLVSGRKGSLKTTRITIPCPTETCQDDSGIKNTTKNQNKIGQTHLSLMLHFISIFILEKGNWGLSLHNSIRQIKTHGVDHILLR